MRVQSRKIGIAAFGAALAVLGAAGAARAADMPFAPALEPPPVEQPVLFGTGWYIRGDLGIAKDTPLPVGGATLPSSKSFPNSWSIGAGFGYKYNSWLRTDVTLDWRRPREFQGNTGFLPCAQGSTPVVDPLTGITTGSTFIYGTCADNTRARLTSLHALFNVYADLGTWGGFTPYVGAGVGVNWIYQKVSQNWFMGNGLNYNLSWVDPFSSMTYYANWDMARSVKTVQLAWALMGGVSYAVTPNTSIDVGYRYLDLGRVQSMVGFAQAATQRLKTQEVRVGVRYTPDF